jgi:putative protease
MQNKPELLLPAGNTESFFASLGAGANAVYLGLEQLNARGRASNFTRNELLAVLKEAGKRNVRIYVTLNTVVKNSELPLLLEYLHFLNMARIDGVIVQDWGVVHLARKFFPELKIHASTQLGVHNSTGIQYLAEKGFSRVVLARELTLNELKVMVKKSAIETEVFVHGALCYSFSGMCLFSSYLGGRGANRGLCAQPCRRLYRTGNNEKYIFNLKDNQLLEYVPQLAEIGVTSLKIEGRLKPGEYTCRVGKAYRAILDNKNNMVAAQLELTKDLGRQKTSYFVGNDVKNAVSEETGTGILASRVEKVLPKKMLVSSSIPIEPGFRLRCHSPENAEPVFIQVDRVIKEGQFFRISTGNQKIVENSTVYIVKLNDQKFQNRLENAGDNVLKSISPAFKKSILTSLKTTPGLKKEELYFRINSTVWLERINFNELDGLFLSFSRAAWNRFNPADEFIQSNRKKVFVELPKFIAEKSIGFYTELVTKMVENGIQNFVIGHLSQKLLIPGNCKVVTSENVYAFNDATIQFLYNEGIENFVYPFEMDFETMESLENKNGIVPVFFYPELFYSRMPVQLGESGIFTGDGSKSKYRRFRRNGITSVVPDQPVSILQHKKRLVKNGFHRFLIDVSFDTFSKNRLKTLKSRFLKSEQIQPSGTFNFVKGLK